VLIIFIVMLYASNAFDYYYPLTGIKPLYWHMFSIGSAASLLFLSHFSYLKTLPKSLLIWGWVYLTISIFGFLYSSQSAVAEQILIYKVEAVALLFSFWLILHKDGNLKNARIGLIGIVIFGVCMNIVDFQTSAWTTTFGRAAGLYENPNLSGKTLVLSMLASIPLISKKMRIIYCLFVGVGVLLTFSRSSWMLWALVVTGLAITGYFGQKSKGSIVGLVTLMAFFVVYSLITGGALELFVQLGLSDYLTSGTLARLGAEGGGFTDYSTVARIVSSMMAWDAFADNPWIGSGLGYTREWSGIIPHSMYLINAAEGGLLALGVFIAFLIILWRMAGKLGKVLVAGFAFYSLFSHTMLMQPTLLVLIPFFVDDHQDKALD